MGSRVEGLKIQTQASISNAQQFLHPQRGDNSYLSDLGAEWGGSMTVCKTLAYPELSESSSLEESLSPQLLTAVMVFSAPLWGPGQAEVWNKFSLSTDPLSFPWGLWVSPRHMIWGPAHWSPGVWAAIGDTCMLSHVSRFATPWTVGWQAPLSMGFSKQKWNPGLLCLLHCRQITKMTLKLLGFWLGLQWIYRKNQQPNTIVFQSMNVVYPCLLFSSLILLYNFHGSQYKSLAHLSIDSWVFDI